MVLKTRRDVLHDIGNYLVCTDGTMFDLTIALLGLVVVQELIKFILAEFVSHLGHWFLFFCFRSEKIQNLMRKGAKKNI